MLARRILAPRILTQRRLAPRVRVIRIRVLRIRVLRILALRILGVDRLVIPTVGSSALLEDADGVLKHLVRLQQAHGIEATVRGHAALTLATLLLRSWFKGLGSGVKGLDFTV